MLGILRRSVSRHLIAELTVIPVQGSCALKLIEVISLLFFDNVIFRNHNIYWGTKWQRKPSTAIYIEEGDLLSGVSFSNCDFQNNTYNAYWLNGNCGALGISRPIECSEEIW